MARFPKSEPKIAALARLIAQGLADAPDDFPSPPVSPAELFAQIDDFHKKDAAVAAAKAETKERRVAKKEALRTLKDSMRANLRYAEIMARRNPEWLTQLGWRRRRPPTPIKAPGEVRDIAIRGEGDTWLVLEWKAPVDGGEVATYKIQRRQKGRAWEVVATSMDPNELLRDQPRGVELEYRVIAMNKAGDGRPSGVVTAVL